MTNYLPWKSSNSISNLNSGELKFKLLPFAFYQINNKVASSQNKCIQKVLSSAAFLPFLLFFPAFFSSAIKISANGNYCGQDKIWSFSMYVSLCFIYLKFLVENVWIFHWWHSILICQDIKVHIFWEGHNFFWTYQGTSDKIEWFLSIVFGLLRIF